MKKAKNLDSVSEVLEQWKSERPELKAKVPSIAARVLRLANHLRRRAEQRQASIGLPWEIAVIIITLKRNRRPYMMTPTALYKSMLLTSGTITSRLNKAEAAGFIRRTASLEDRRSVLIQLTDEGIKKADQAITEHFLEMDMLLAEYGPTESKELARLLSKLLAQVEGIIGEDT